MSPSRVVISALRSARLSSFSFLSELHQSSLFLSSLPSSSFKVIIFSISSKTFSKGLPASTTAKAFAIRSDFADVRICSNSRRNTASLRRWPSCKKEAAALVFPVEVAETVPNVSKALSLLRIAIASAMAASSLARSSLRASYSFALAAHVSFSWDKNSSASDKSFFAVVNCFFLDESASSLELSVSCFSLKVVSIDLNASSLVFMNASYASFAAFSVALAVSKLDSNVARISFRIPTISPD
mmetsp:Transcript_104729/g.165320  ORF Transcript_104729/g.165320 Transcript_104729/m.165320 type:complete len:242 (-) Transcript_104729:51-776(-)